MVTDLNVKENALYKSNEQVFKILLKDRTTKKNLIWATDGMRSVCGQSVVGR